MKYKH